MKLTQRDLIQRIGGSAEMPARQMQINRGVLQMPVSQEQLDGAQICSGLQHVGREAVPPMPHAA